MQRAPMKTRHNVAELVPVVYTTRARSSRVGAELKTVDGGFVILPRSDSLASVSEALLPNLT